MNQVKLPSGNSAYTHTYDQAAFGKEIYADCSCQKNALEHCMQPPRVCSFLVQLPVTKYIDIPVSLLYFAHHLKL
jgi:hypothetical protein